MIKVRLTSELATSFTELSLYASHFALRYEELSLEIIIGE
jgi:hypothetical protein